MTTPLTAFRRLGIVQALVAGPPPRVTVTLGGDEDTTHVVDAPYLDSYTPVVGDVVVILANQGGHLVLGSTSVGAQTAYTQATANVGSITTTQVVLLTASPVVASGGETWRAMFGWDTASSTVANARLELRIQRAVDTGGGLGAYVDISRMAPRITVAVSNEGGGTLLGLDPAVTAGAYTYRVTAVRSASDTGTLTVAASATMPMTLTVDRFS